MAKNCDACSDLRENSPEFIQEGVTKTVCTSLKNNTGFNPSLSPKHTDCEDLEDANDCLIGNLEDELLAYDVCDWKEFMGKMLPNEYNVNAAMICAICGIWSAIDKILARLDKLECLVDFLFKGYTFKFGENSDQSQSYLRAGKGVSYKLRSNDDELSADCAIQYVAGGLCFVYGSLRLFQTDFYDKDGTSLRSGNPEWGRVGAMVSGGELLYEYRIKKSQFPEIKNIFNGFGQEVGGGSYHMRILKFDEGEYSYGQHGACLSNGKPAESGFSDGIKVPEGWMYLQVRMSTIWELHFPNHDDGKGIARPSGDYSPRGLVGIRFNQSAIDC